MVINVLVLNILPYDFLLDNEAETQGEAEQLA